MAKKHVCIYRVGRGSVDVCRCGRFRHNEKAGPFIVAKEKVVDVSVSNHGSVILFAPLTDKAREWINDNVQAEGWQFFGGSLAVEPRFAFELTQGMKDAGLEVV